VSNWFDYQSLAEGATMKDVEQMLLDEVLIELDPITMEPVKPMVSTVLPVASRAPAPTWVPPVRPEEDTAGQRLDVTEVLRQTRPREAR
jgi:hypothetical protein